MKRHAHLLVPALLAATALVAPGLAAASGVDVGVSVQISQPGVYGRIDIGRFPQPGVMLPQPVIIAPPRPPRPPVGVVVAPPPPPQPVYMWVPPGHQKNWRRHCARYNACSVPVYFVRDDWYERHVQPRDRWEDRSRGRGRGHDDDRGRGRDRDGDRGRGHGRDDDHGRGRGRD